MVIVVVVVVVTFIFSRWRERSGDHEKMSMNRSISMSVSLWQGVIVRAELEMKTISKVISELVEAGLESARIPRKINIKEDKPVLDNRGITAIHRAAGEVVILTPDSIADSHEHSVIKPCPHKFKSRKNCLPSADGWCDAALGRCPFPELK